MTLMVFQSVEILISLPTYLAPIRFFFLHAESARIGRAGRRIDDTERAVRILVQLLRIMSVLRGIR